MIYEEDVLITSKTKWGDKYCVGGLELATGRFVRLMTSLGGYQPHNCPFEIGQVWRLEFTYKPDRPPHVEDVRITSRKRIGGIAKMDTYIKANCKIWKGDYNTLFDGHLNWTFNGSGYLGNPKKLPANSVGFWISDEDLIWDGNKYYLYMSGRFIKKRFPYKGVIPPVKVIPKGTLIRMSLAKWLKGDKFGVGERCYAQISGWY